jgi:thiosulfate reductase cytochrome b subunit
MPRDADPPRPIPSIHPRIVRVTHWLNAIAVVVMTGSGWQIYNAYPLLPFAFPGEVTIGGWLGGALLWHFAAMWLLAANGAVYLVYGIASGRFRRKLWPIRPADLGRDFLAALRGRLAHDDLGTYNAVQKSFYVVVLLALVVIVLSGLALWKPVQLDLLASLFGGFQGARAAHFAAMVAIVGFVIVHIAMALLVPKSIRAMVRGR